MSDFPVEQLYDEALRFARADDRVLGLILMGSRGRGFENEWSDFDVQLVVEPGCEAACEQRWADTSQAWDLWATTLDAMKATSLDDLWQRRSYVRLKPVVDKTGGELAQLVDDLWHVRPDEVQGFVHGSLDAYINAVYRSVKSLRAGDEIGHRLDAAASIEPALNAAFALHDRRLVPFPKYLHWELENFPLARLPWSAADLLDGVLAVLATGDLAVQQRLLRDMETLARSGGFDRTFDEWEGKDQWAMRYRPS